MAYGYTASQIVNTAFVFAGIGAQDQPIAGADFNAGFNYLNDMLMQWYAERYMIWHLQTYSVTSTGSQTYSVGPGGDIDIPYRPDYLEYSFFRQLQNNIPAKNAVDYSLQILTSKEQYDKITLKSLDSWPYYIFYDTGYPIGNLYPWPIPASSLFEIFITVRAEITPFTSLATNIVFPPQYFYTLYISLAEILRTAYGYQENPDLSKKARAARAIVRSNNTQIPLLNMPRDLVKPSVYNIYSDQVR